MNRTGAGKPSRKRSTITLEAILIVLSVILVYALSYYYDFLDRFYEFSREHEDWELDEIFFTVAYLAVVFAFMTWRRWREMVAVQAKLRQRNAELEAARREVKQLRGIMPICSNCKSIRDDKGYWHEVEKYVSEHSDADFSHGLCPACIRKLYPDFADDVVNNSEEKTAPSDDGD